MNQLTGYSAHADQKDLAGWVAAMAKHTEEGVLGRNGHQKPLRERDYFSVQSSSAAKYPFSVLQVVEFDGDGKVTSH